MVLDPNKNLIRFDWAIKRLLRQKANFAVLEGFLSALLSEKVKINEILESESNKKNHDSKQNRVDILAKNSKDELIIIEVQNNMELDFFHRVLFGTSTAIVEHLKQGTPYGTIQKVYAISICYFTLGSGDDYVYRGTVIFRGLHTLRELFLSKSQQTAFGKLKPGDILPEYFVINVNQFDDIAKDSLDEWIYYLKNSDLKDEFNSPGIDEARKALEISRMSKDESDAYHAHIQDRMSLDNQIFSARVESKEEGIEEGKAIGIEEGKAIGIEEGKTIGIEEGKAIGIEEGIELNRKITAKEMLAQGLDISLISVITKLSIETIQDLINNG